MNTLHDVIDDNFINRLFSHPAFIQSLQNSLKNENIPNALRPSMSINAVV